MKLFLGSTLLVIAFTITQAYSQEDTIYEGNASGTIENSNDWSNGAPNANLYAIISPGGFFTGDTIGTISTNTVITISETTNEAAAGLEAFSTYNIDNNNSTVAGTVNLNLSSGVTLTIGQNFNDGVLVTNQTTLNFSGGTMDVLGGNIILGEQPFEENLVGQGNFNITSGVLTFNNSSLYVGLDTNSTATFTQSGFANVTGQNLFIGEGGSNGTYNLQSGTLTINGDAVLADATGSTAVMNQSGGTFTYNGVGPLVIGEAGSGTYNFTSGNVNVNSDLLIGSDDGVGTFNQINGAVTVTGGTTLGDDGTGSYTIRAGSVNFEGGLILGADGGTGTFTQLGGTVTIANGQQLDLSEAGSSYTLSAGTLQIGTNGLVGGAGDGKFNFGGGTLVTTGNVTDALDGTFTGSTSISSGGTVILSGTLTGNGSLTVVNGTVQASTANLPQISGVNLHTGTALNLTTSGAATDTFTGTISGTGNLSTGNAGVNAGGGVIATPAGYILVLPKAVNLTGGTTTIAAGTGVHASSGTFNTITAGAGSTFEVGSATGGALTILGTATVPNITVDSGSSLTVGHVVGNLLNNGTLNTAAPEGTLTVSGSLNQPQHGTVAQEGTLNVRTNGTLSDIYVANNANLFGSVEVHGVGSNIYTIVQTSAPGQLTTGTLNSATPGGLAVVDSSDLFTATLSYGNAGSALQLTTVQSNLSPFATTPNQKAVAAAIDQVIQNPPAVFVPILTGINAQGSGALPAELDQLTPQSYLYMRDIAFENSTFLSQKVDRFLDNLRTGYSGLDTNGLSVLNPGMGSGLGRSLGSLLAYNNEGSAPNGVNYYPEDESSMLAEPGPSGPISRPATISDTSDPRMAPTVAPPPSTSVFDGTGSGFNEFISGDVVLADLNQNNSGSSQPKARYTAGNATGGVSFRINSNLAAGVLFDYNHTDAKTDSQSSHVRVDSYSPGLFATFFEKGFYANGLFTFGYDKYSNNRDLDFGGTGGSAHSSPDGQQYSGNFDFGYDFHPDKHWVIGPTLGVQYTHLDVDSFQESGAGPVDLHVDSQSADSLRARIGGRVVYLVHSGSILFQPNFTASFQREFLNDPFHLTSQLDIPGTPSFATQGSNPGRNTGLIGLGLTATLDNSMNLYLDYLAEYGGDDYFVQSIEGGVKANF